MESLRKEDFRSEELGEFWGASERAARGDGTLRDSYIMAERVFRAKQWHADEHMDTGHVHICVAILHPSRPKGWVLSHFCG